MAGYYNEETGEWIEDDAGGIQQELTNETSGADTNIAGTDYDYWAAIGINPDSISKDGTPPTNDEIWNQIQGGGSWLSRLGQSALTGLKNTFTKKVNGQDVTDWRAIAGAAGGLYGMYQSQQRPEKTGYQGKIPEYTAVREKVANTYDPERRPGSTAQKYFTDTKFVAPTGAEAARTTAKEEAAGLEALNKANPARQERGVLQAGAEKKEEKKEEVKPASSVIKDLPVPEYATGGIATMAKGRYLAGATDGMADKIPARIGGKQEARLSHGEFVIPADVVGHLGNGNSEAGAKRLYAMMDKIRKARTGTAKQGKQINPDKFLA
jgi:hypothetical protein